MIRLNRSIERNYKLYKRTNNERTLVSEQNPHLVPHDRPNSLKFERANLAVSRATLQLQCYQNY